MKDKKILYIDMDGVIADFGKAINDIDPSVDMSNSTVNYNNRADRVDEICLANPNIFHNLEPMPDSIEYVKKLFELYEVYFLSTPMWIVPESFTGKRIWLETHFGKMAAKRLILTHRKDLNIGAYLVDDRKHNGAGEFTGMHIHFGTDRFPTWESVYDYLWTKAMEDKLELIPAEAKHGKSNLALAHGVLGIGEFDKTSMFYKKPEDIMIQIRIIEDNDNEGERFSYVMHVSEDRAQEIKAFIETLDEDYWDIEMNTNYTEEQMEQLNDHVDNGYMDYIGFYRIPDGAELTEDLFYKGSGLERL